MVIKITSGSDVAGLLDYIFELKTSDQPTGSRPNENPLSIKCLQDVPTLGATQRKGEVLHAVEGQALDAEVGNRRSKRFDHAIRLGRAELIATNMAGRTKRELLQEFVAFASFRPDVKANFLHIIVSTPEKDQVTSGMQAQIADRLALLTGLDRRAYAAFRHKDHPQDEIHLVTTKSDVRGKLPSDAFLYDRFERVARQLEEEFGLSRNRGSREAMRRCPTQSEYKQFERTGNLGTIIGLQATVDTVLKRNMSFTEFADRLEQKGVRLSLLVDEKWTGMIYEFEGKKYKGRRLGRGYTFTGLQKEWSDQQERKGRMIYDPERDNESFSKRASKYERRGHNTTELCQQPIDRAIDREPARQPSREARQVGELDTLAATEQPMVGNTSSPHERPILTGGAAPIRGSRTRQGDRNLNDEGGAKTCPDSEPTTARDKQYLQARKGRDDHRIQEVPSANERRFADGKPGSSSVSFDDRSVQSNDSGVLETGRTVQRESPDCGQDDQRRSQDNRPASDSSRRRLNESRRGGQGEVSYELPLFDAALSPTHVDSDYCATERLLTGSIHQRVEIGSPEPSISDPIRYDEGERTENIHEHHYEGGLAFSEHGGIGTAGQETLNAVGNFLIEDSSVEAVKADDEILLAPKELIWNPPDYFDQHVGITPFEQTADRSDYNDSIKTAEFSSQKDNAELEVGEIYDYGR
jgi:hypothetical protein